MGGEVFARFFAPLLTVKNFERSKKNVNFEKNLKIPSMKIKTSKSSQK